MLQNMNEVAWLQIMYRDVVKHDVQLENWRNSLSPHMLIMRGSCTLRNSQPQCAVTDAKSLYDCIMKEHPSGKQDRKSAMELAIIVKDLKDTGSMVRWVPHQKMLVDTMTKEDPSRTNGALEHFLKTGRISFVDERLELEQRRNDLTFKRGSRGAAELRRQYEEQFQGLVNPLLETESSGSCDSD